MFARAPAKFRFEAVELLVDDLGSEHLGRLLPIALRARAIVIPKTPHPAQVEAYPSRVTESLKWMPVTKCDIPPSPALSVMLMNLNLHRFPPLLVQLPLAV